MRTLFVIRCAVVTLFAFASTGCENQQPVIDALEKGKTQLTEQLSEAGENIDTLVAENKVLQEGMDSARAAATAAQESAKQVQTTMEESAKQTKAAAAESAKQVEEARQLAATASEEAKKLVANAHAQAKEMVAAAEKKLASVTQELKVARERITQLEAAAKESDEPESDE